MIELLTLEKAVLGVHFEKGFLYWDNCGKIWRDIVAKYPELEADSVSTEGAQLSIGDESLSIKFNTKSINVSQDYPANLNNFGKFINDAVHLISNYLEIKSFSRIGNRFIYILPVDNLNEVLKLFKKTGFFNIPTEKLAKFGKSISEPSLRFIVNEDEDFMNIINLKYMARTVVLKVPKPLKLDTSKFISTGLSIDIDRITVKPVDLSILDFEEYVRVNSRKVGLLIEDLFMKE